MESPISGNNVIAMEAPKGSMAEMEAIVKAAEAQGLANLTDAPGAANPTSTSQTQDVVNPVAPDAEPPANKVDVPQQFKDKEGNLDEKKLLKSKEHLEKGIVSKAERAAKLLKEHKELQEKFRQTSEEAKRLEVETANPLAGLDEENLSPEFKQKLMDDLEKDYVGTTIKLQKAIIQREFDRKVKPLDQKVTEIHQKHRNDSDLEEIDSLIEEGHTWIADEGLVRFDKAFSERPWLRQSPNKYRDALRFIDGAPFAGTDPSGQTQARTSTPILGANRAVPPPSVHPPVSADETMNELKEQFDAAMKGRNFVLADQIQKKMDVIYRSQFQ